MNDIIDQFRDQQNELISDVINDPSNRNYWSSFKKIKKLISSNVKFKEVYDCKIAMLSSFTIDPLATYLDIDSRIIGLLPQTYIGPFNQYQQEILNNESNLFKFNPEVIIFFVQLESLLDIMFLPNFPKMKTKEKENIIETVFNSIKEILENLMNKTNALILFSNFIIPTFSPLGIMDNKVEIGLKSFYHAINKKLEQFSKKSSSLFVLDLNKVASDFGKSKYRNDQMFYRGLFLFSDNFLPEISYEVMGYIKALKGKNRKVLVLDLDNTLWGGIVGEDGIEGIKLNKNFPGNDYFDFQKSILSLYNRGIIIAINSKNDESYALEVFKQHPFMILKENHIGSYRINWLDKATNIIEIAKELNVGIDSLVFIDDNPVERERVKTSAPGVLTVDISGNSALFKKSLEKLNDFNNLTLTKEDLKRGEMYFARRKRKGIENNVQSIDDFIKTLEIKVIIKEIDKFSQPRVTSLINKTNQFNLTTRRYNESEVNDITSNSDKIIYTLQVNDKYGDEGIVGVAIIHKDVKVWEINNLLMSCRVIGRKIETAFLKRIYNQAMRENVNTIIGKYIPTKKNNLVKDLFKNHGFNLLEEKPDGSSSWKKELIEEDLSYPELLEIIED